MADGPLPESRKKIKIKGKVLLRAKQSSKLDETNVYFFYQQSSRNTFN